MISQCFESTPHCTRWRQRIGCVLLALLVAVAQAGCATHPASAKLPDNAERDLGNVAFVATPVEPEIKLGEIPSGKGSGALSAAGGTFSHCMGGLNGSGSCSGGGSLGAAVCGAAVLLWLGVCVIATGVAAVVGATVADNAKAVQSGVVSMTTALDAKTIQAGLRDQVAKSAAEASAISVASYPPDAASQAALAKDYRPLAAAGVDHVIETSLIKVGVAGRGLNPPLMLYMQAQVRVVSTRDNEQRFAHQFLYLSEEHVLKEWAADQGAVLRRAMEAGFARLGSSIADQVFQLYDFPSRQAQDRESFGLAAVYPKNVVSFRTNYLVHDSSWSSIDSLQPTLRWQSFPRDVDRTAAPAVMERVSGVRYDVLVAEEIGLAPGPIVASASGIATNSYRLEMPLKPGRKYFWAVRARFELDGRQRVTEWATSASGTSWVLGKMFQGDLFPRSGMQWAIVQPSAASNRFQTAAGSAVVPVDTALPAQKDRTETVRVTPSPRTAEGSK